MRQYIDYDLKALLADLVAQESGVTELYVFGSRAYGTGSQRSDCDVLVRADPQRDVKGSNLLEYASDRCPALDLFLCTEARAVSAANDSYVYATTFEDLVHKLDAVRLWTRKAGFENFAFPTSGSWTFRTSALVDFVPTGLPDGPIADLAWQQKFKRIEGLGLPTEPYIGDTLEKAAVHIAYVARRMIFRKDQIGQRGIAKDGWTVKISSEYECQNLFFTVVKPWLPGLGREQVVIRYDNQDKSADFDLFEGRLIIEMKFIDAVRKKAEVVKTLDGLSRFYARNANVGILLLIIFVKHGVELDDAKWESDYSFKTVSPQIMTVVVRVP